MQLDWKQTIEQHGPAVWKRIFRIVGNEADASDCFQEVFLKAVKTSRQQAIQNMGGFLSLAATRCAIDCLRRRRKLPLFSTDVADDLPDFSCSVDPSGSLRNGELTEALRSGLARLPAPQAEAFALLVFEELSYRQIADHMRIRENHVGVLINRARGRLRELLNSVAVEYDREAGPNG
jgi:RNA polymerase sigma-70 factor (ECF subfamily)